MFSLIDRVTVSCVLSYIVSSGHCTADVGGMGRHLNGNGLQASQVCWRQKGIILSMQQSKHKYCRFLVKILVKILLLFFDSCELYKVMIKVWHIRQLLSLLSLIQKGEITELHVSTCTSVK